MVKIIKISKIGDGLYRAEIKGFKKKNQVIKNNNEHF